MLPKRFAKVQRLQHAVSVAGVAKVLEAEVVLVASGVGQRLL